MPDNTKYTSQYSGAQIDGAIDKVGLISDYVVESVLDNDANHWSYIKYKSGIAILWGIFALDQETGTYRRKPEADSQGDGRFSNIIYLQTPFQVAYATISGMAQNLYIMTNPGGSYDNQTVSFRLWRYGGMISADTNVRIHVIGKWVPVTNDN